MQAALEKGEFESDHDFGDAEAAAKSAAHVIEATIRSPSGACDDGADELHGAFFRRRLEVWGGFQDGLGARVHAAKVAGLAA